MYLLFEVMSSLLDLLQVLGEGRMSGGEKDCHHRFLSDEETGDSERLRGWVSMRCRTTLGRVRGPGKVSVGLMYGASYIPEAWVRVRE